VLPNTAAVVIVYIYEIAVSRGFKRHLLVMKQNHVLLDE
jgi:hypothetical protein